MSGGLALGHRRCFVASVAMALVGCATARAVPPGYFEVESREVRADRRALNVRVSEYDRRFRAIALQATGHAILVERVRVVYTQDDFVDFTEPVALDAGQCSDPLPLPGNYRSVRAVEVAYRVPSSVRVSGGRLHVFALR